MPVRPKHIFFGLTTLLLTIANIAIISIVDIAIKSTYGYNNSLLNYLIWLTASALGVSIISYYLTRKLSNDDTLLKDKIDTELKLKKALSNIKKINKAMQHEIAERKKIEKALVDSEGQVNAIIQKAPTGIALLDKEGWILECNHALQNMLGYGEDELTGVRFVQAIHPQDVALYNNKFQELINGASDIYRIDTRYIHREFREVWGSLSASIVRDAAGQPQFVIAMVEDITTKQQAEEKIVNYQKQLQSLTSELSLIEERERRSIATDLHDHVGQVLTLIGLKVDELQENLSAPACAPLLAEIKTRIGQTIRSIRSLMFELSPPVLYDFGLEEAIEWLAEHFSQEHTLKIQVTKDEQPKPLQTEGNVILFQSVKELLMNIVKHAHATSVKISIQRACNDLRIIVEDNGVGFNINLIDRNQHKIKGFGLFSIYERLEYYGGRMIIESNEDQGTTITLLMPMVSTEKPEWYNNLSKYMDSNQNSQLAKN